jgi:hypothetical protein
MNIALDIDGTITVYPEFFAILSRAIRAAGGKVYIITSRSDDEAAREQTRQELAFLRVEFDDLFIIPGGRQGQIPCPHSKLDWDQKYLWQKVNICLDHKVSIVFEDDPKVIALFEEFAPNIQVFQVR